MFKIIVKKWKILEIDEESVIKNGNNMKNFLSVVIKSCLEILIYCINSY